MINHGSEIKIFGLCSYGCCLLVLHLPENWLAFLHFFFQQLRLLFFLDSWRVPVHHIEGPADTTHHLFACPIRVNTFLPASLAWEKTKLRLHIVDLLTLVAIKLPDISRNDLLEVAMFTLSITTWKHDYTGGPGGGALGLIWICPELSMADCPSGLSESITTQRIWWVLALLLPSSDRMVLRGSSLRSNHLHISNASNSSW